MIVRSADFYTQDIERSIIIMKKKYFILALIIVLYVVVFVNAEDAKSVKMSR